MEYTWIAGATAIGKKTFTKEILRKNQVLSSRFGFQGNIEVFGEKFDGEIPPENYTLNLEKLTKADADHVVIKWQYRTTELILDLFHEKPQAAHRVLFLWRNFNEHFLHFCKKDSDRHPELNDSMTNTDWIEKCERGRKTVQKWFEQFDTQSIKITIVDASENKYEVLDKWPP